MIGQLLIGTPGSGKTSFCYAMKKIISTNEEYPIFINLDPGNNFLALNSDINIQELLHSGEIGSELNLGPNGSLLYSIEYFEKNSDWLENKISNLIKNTFSYHFLFDFPGQIELFTHHKTIRKFIKRILTLNIKLIALTFTDSFFFRDKTLRNSLLMICILVMLNIELPHLHLISKFDLIRTRNLIKNMQNFRFSKYQFTYSKNISSKSSFFWSNKLSFDLKILIMEFSSLNSSSVSIYFPDSIKLVYKKIKGIII